MGGNYWIYGETNVAIDFDGRYCGDLIFASDDPFSFIRDWFYAPALSHQ